MSEKTRKVRLGKAFTWAGKNYAPGIVDLPESAANYAVKRKVGKLVGENAGDSGLSEDFDPLSLEETMARFQSGDSSDEVFQSLKFHQATIIAGAPRRDRDEGDGGSAGEKTDGKQIGKTESETETSNANGLPEDFPMKHVFEQPNELSEKGFQSVAEIQGHSLEDLVKINGIAEKTAQKALNYGK